MQTNSQETGTPPRTNVMGAQVGLGPLSRVLIPRYQDWMNDFPTQGSAGYPPRPQPWTDEAMAQWFERAATDQQNLWFTIYATVTWQAIGMCILRDIDMQHRTAEFGITIGDHTQRGKGYGTEAVQLLLDIAFTGLGLNNIQLHVFAFNHAGIHAYHKAGFKEIGRRRQAYFMGGTFWDVIIMDCLAADFHSPVLRDMLTPKPDRV